jgi:tRNA A-37 threonylcarbamoyl transferase component Bud32
MNSISKEEYQQLIKGADIIEEDGFGIKVLETKNNEMIKLFRRKRFFSTALLKPYAVRFVDNAKKLHSLGIPTINIKQLLWCSSTKRHIVIYEKLEGELLREALTKDQKKPTKLFQTFASFIAELHEKGVYFRSAHLKNILLLPNGAFGLIDISDMQIKRQSLNINLRQRNFEHILRYQEDKALLRKSLDSFLLGYNSPSKLREEQAKKIEQTIKQIIC